MTDFYLMDLERTLQSGTPCFWKGNKFGYTYKIEFAGIFPKKVAEQIVNSDRDNKTISIPLTLVKQILGEELKQHEGF
jgi:hypothetical protein